MRISPSSAIRTSNPGRAAPTEPIFDRRVRLTCDAAVTSVSPYPSPPRIEATSSESATFIWQP